LGKMGGKARLLVGGPRSSQEDLPKKRHDASARAFGQGVKKRVERVTGLYVQKKTTNGPTGEGNGPVIENYAPGRQPLTKRIKSTGAIQRVGG